LLLYLVVTSSDPMIGSLILNILVICVAVYLSFFATFWLYYFLALLFLRGVLVIITYISAIGSLHFYRISCGVLLLFLILVMLPSHTSMYLTLWLGFTHLGFCCLLFIILLIYFLLVIMYFFLSNHSAIRSLAILVYT